MGNVKPVVLVDKITGEIVARYSNAHAAAGISLVPYETIWNQAQRKTVGFNRYIWRYAESYNRHESFENCRVNVPLELYRNGVVKYVANIDYAARLLSCARSSVSYAVNHNCAIHGVRVRRLRFMGDIREIGKG